MLERIKKLLESATGKKIARSNAKELRQLHGKSKELKELGFNFEDGKGFKDYVNDLAHWKKLVDLKGYKSVMAGLNTAVTTYNSPKNPNKAELKDEVKAIQIIINKLEKFYKRNDANTKNDVYGKKDRMTKKESLGADLGYRLGLTYGAYGVNAPNVPSTYNSDDQTDLQYSSDNNFTFDRITGLTNQNNIENEESEIVEFNLPEDEQDLVDYLNSIDGVLLEMVMQPTEEENDVATLVFDNNVIINVNFDVNDYDYDSVLELIKSCDFDGASDLEFEPSDDMDDTEEMDDTEFDS